MGRRKAGTKPVKKTQPKVDTTFSCPFCNHANTVECKIRRKEHSAVIRCRVCDANYQTFVTELSEPVDVYCQWIDACEDANKRLSMTRSKDLVEEDDDL